MRDLCCRYRRDKAGGPAMVCYLLIASLTDRQALQARPHSIGDVFHGVI
jgi:hypothetical protein